MIREFTFAGLSLSQSLTITGKAKALGLGVDPLGLLENDTYGLRIWVYHDDVSDERWDDLIRFLNQFSTMDVA